MADVPSFVVQVERRILERLVYSLLVLHLLVSQHLKCILVLGSIVRVKMHRLPD